MRASQTTRFSSGFTLMELLVVVAIIGILVGIVLGVSGYASRKSATTKARAELERVKTALEEYRIEYGRYFGPANGDTTALVVGGESFTNAMLKYIKNLQFTDPWGRAYQYSNSVNHAYKLWSLGMNAADNIDDIESGDGSY